MNLYNSFQSLRLFLQIIIFISVNVPTSLSNIDNKYQTCAPPFQLSSKQNIGYPFWGLDRPDYCGYPGFELFRIRCIYSLLDPYRPFNESSCVKSGITILGVQYEILNISAQSKTLTLVKKDYWNDDCYIAGLTLNRTLLDFTLFDYTSDTRNLTLYYNCPRAQGEISKTMLRYQFNCSSNETMTNNNYYFAWNSSSLSTPEISTYLESCAENVAVPVWQSTVRDLEKSPNSIPLYKALGFGFGVHWYADNSLCDECERSQGVCGYDNGTRQFTCFCPDGPYPLTCQPNQSPANQSGSFNFSLSKKTAIGNTIKKIAIGVSAGVVGIAVITVLFWMHRKTIFFWKKQTLNDHLDVEAVIRKYGSLAPKRYNYSDVKKMTNSFTDKVGQGGYGVVYRGKLNDGRIVAVKVLSESKGNGEEFINEVACISGTSHVNIVTLLGFCYKGNKRALIYEFMSNGSLDKFIYNKDSMSTNDNHLDWKTLSQIVVGVARGLEYLHRDCNTRIVHFDIKPHNILLDEDFCPKISDFGLAKLCKKKESIISMLDARGTVGYIAPEVVFRNYGGVSHKSDVYGFGMMVLEMVGVRNNIASGATNTSSEIYFPDWIYKLLEPGEDRTLRGIVTEEEEEEIARKMIIVSLWCIQTNPSDRPSMSKAVEMLEGGLESLQVPPKPSLNSSFPRSIQYSSMTTTSLS